MDVVIVVTASSLRHAKSLADGLMEQCTKNNYESCAWKAIRPGSGFWLTSTTSSCIFPAGRARAFRIESLWKESPALYGEMPAVSPRHAEPAGDED